MRAEGKIQYAGLLFIPETPPYDLFDPQRRHRVRLYVKRVFITDECEGLIPPYLRFLQGVVDSDDLPLNVSRELLQDSSVVRVIRKQVIKKTLDLLEEMATDQKFACTYLAVTDTTSLRHKKFSHVRHRE